MQTLGTRGANKTAITCFAHDAAKNLALVGGQDGSLRTWDLAERKSLDVHQAHDNSVYSVRFSADGKLAASASFDRTIRVWAVEKK